MKKIATIFMALAMMMTTVFCFAACTPEASDKAKTYTVYAPDGAPALALANAVDKSDDDCFEYHIVAASTIVAQVTGESPAADFCILPVNAAASKLGTGEVYQMLGTVTNGNMYFLTTEGETLTADNLEVLVGKKVGVVQLANVPGLTFRAVLREAVLREKGIDYQVLSGEVESSADKVNLQPIQDAATGVTPAGGCDYYLCPEPVASAKIKGTASSAKPFRFAGSLQKLYGEGNGYPQAVLVAKKSIIQSDLAAVNQLIGYMSDSAQFLAECEATTVVSLLENCYTKGMTPSLNANNLTSTVIANCSVRFTAAQSCKEQVNTFLAKLIAVVPDFTSSVEDGFYYHA